MTPRPTVSTKHEQPSGKHPDVYLRMLKASCQPGETCVDPMCGSGMLAVAAEVLNPTHKLDWWMIEEKKSFREIALQNTLAGYHQLVVQRKDEAQGQQEVIGLPTDFREITPGSPQWMRFWEENPDQNQEMLLWRKEKGK